MGTGSKLLDSRVPNRLGRRDPAHLLLMAGLGRSNQLAQDVRENPAVSVVVDLDGCINTALDADLILLPIGPSDLQCKILLRSQADAHSDDVKSLGAIQTQGLRGGLP